MRVGTIRRFLVLYEALICMPMRMESRDIGLGFQLGKGGWINATPIVEYADYDR